MVNGAWICPKPVSKELAAKLGQVSATAGSGKAICWNLARIFEVPLTDTGFGASKESLASHLPPEAGWDDSPPSYSRRISLRLRLCLNLESLRPSQWSATHTLARRESSLIMYPSGYRVTQVVLRTTLPLPLKGQAYPSKPQLYGLLGPLSYDLQVPVCRIYQDETKRLCGRGPK